MFDITFLPPTALNTLSSLWGSVVKHSRKKVRCVLDTNSVARSEFTAATSVPSPTDLPHGELTVQATDIFPAQRLPFDVLLFTTSWIDDDDVISLGRTCHALQAPAYKLYLCRQRILTGRATRMFSGEIITSIRLRASLPAIALRIFSSYSTLKDLGRVLLECQLSLILFSPVSLVSALHGIKVTRVTIPVVPSLLINHPSAHVALIHLLSSLPPSCETIIAEDEVFNDWDEEQPSSIPTIPNPSSFSRTSTLTTLRWQSELWTASGLRNLSVQLFSAPNLQDVTLSARKFSQIAKILPSIRLPSLNTFTVCVAGPKPFHLPQVFFRRHPSLQSLTLLSQPTSYILAFEPPVQHPVLQLPALTHFRATANYGGWKMDDPSSLVCMAFDPMSPRIPPSTNHFCTAMQSLSSQMRKSLDITLQPDFMLSLTLPSRLAHHIHSKGNDFTCSCAVPAEYSITNVYNVELWVDYGGPDILEFLSRWLGCFPALKNLHLNIYDKFKKSPTELQLEILRMHCPQLDHFELMRPDGHQMIWLYQPNVEAGAWIMQSF